MDNQITLYGNRNDVKDLAERLQATIPGGRKMSPEEAKTLAQIAVAHGLDPFNGEVWVIPGSGAMVGIKGLRKAARKQAREEGGSYWTEITRVEPEKYNAPKDAVVYECVLRDSVTMQAWSKSINMITTSGVPYQDAVAMIGKPPVYIGIGIANQAERSKMEIHQRARKRAEADATKQRYDVDFGAEFSAEEPDAVEFVDTVVTEVSPRSNEQIITELGFTVEPEDIIEYPPELAVVTNSEGIPYVSLDSEKLSNMTIGINKALKKNDLTDDQISQYNMKAETIRQILALRNGGK